MTRIAPLEPPYDDSVAQTLTKWMPPGAPVPPLALFRTIAVHPMLRERMRPLGAGLLAHGVLPARVRELAILRTCARCGAGYEWGVHVTAFARVAGLDDAAIRRTVAPALSPDDPDAIVLQVVDELHDTSTLSDATFAAAHERFAAAGVLELAALVGYYHLISYIIGVAAIEPEPWASRMA
jgi:4-carboxymuconolactone decarboxylase